MRHRELLLRDLLCRLAEHVGVLERDVREQDDLCVDDVRRVEPPAQTGLDGRHADPLLGEFAKRGGGQRLELRRLDRLGVRTDPRDRALEVGLCPVDPDSLRPPADVRRRVCARSPPLAAK
jgi:hypothetical protein